MKKCLITILVIALLVVGGRVAYNEYEWVQLERVEHMYE